jgi:hypothetical protein
MAGRLLPTTETEVETMNRRDPDMAEVFAGIFADAKTEPSADGVATEGPTSATYTAAVACLDQGLWPVACYAVGEPVTRKGVVTISDGKAPIGQGWGLQRQTKPGLRELFWGHGGRNVGLCLGPGRGPNGTWPIDIEGDGPEAAQSMAKLLDGVDVRTRGWLSVRGGHALFIADGERLLQLLAAAGAVEDKDKRGVLHLDESPGLEFRIGGFKSDGKTVKQVQSIIPPSLGTDGKPRVGNGVEEIAELPESVYAALEALGERKAMQGEQPSKAFTRTTGSSKRSLAEEINEFAAKPEGKRHPFLLTITMRLAGRVKAGELAEQDVIDGLRDGAKRNGMDAAGRMPEVEELWRTAMIKAEPAGTWQSGKSNQSQNEKVDWASVPESEVAISGHEIDLRPVNWLWPDRLAIGKMSIIAGEGKQGKTMMALAIASWVTTGYQFPDGKGTAPQGKALILSGEDDPEDILGPRLVALDADMTKIKILRAHNVITKKDGTRLINLVSFQDLDYWIDMFRRYGDSKLLIIDPLPAFLGRGVNDHKNADLQQALTPFLELVRERQIALVAITHLSKSIDPTRPASHRILGSIAYANKARSIHFVAREPDNPDRRLFMQSDNTSAPSDLPAVAFTLGPRDITTKQGDVFQIWAPKFELNPVNDVDVNEVINAAVRPKAYGPAPLKADKMAIWLFDYLLAQAKPVQAKTVYDEAGLAFMNETPHPLGTLDIDGNWSNGKLLRRAADRVPFLESPRNGKRVKRWQDATTGWWFWHLIDHTPTK